MNPEDFGSVIPISLVSQYLYCERRAMLIALYGEWDDNEHTASGTLEHKRVHESGVFGNGYMKTYHGLRVASERLGLSGVCDRVDYDDETGKCIPIEYKHGKRRNESEYEAQLCAQALCLEEMLECDIDTAYLYFITEKRRKEIPITTQLRTSTLRAIEELREAIISKKLPPAERSKKCRECSLSSICSPDIAKADEAKAYIGRLIIFAKGGDDL